MSSYNKTYYQSLIQIIKDKFDFEILELHEILNEFSLPGEGIPVFRLVLDENSGTIILYFNIMTSPSVAISIFLEIQASAKALKCGEEYYQNSQGSMFFGQEAFSEYDAELQQSWDSQKLMDENLDINNPVSVVIQTPIRAIWDVNEANQIRTKEKKLKNKLIN